MSAHTPGPWGARPGPDTAWWIGPTVQPGLVASTVGGNDEANARLIAAAPDLLEVAERTMEHFADSLPEHLVEEFRAAIAKARGTP